MASVAGSPRPSTHATRPSAFEALAERTTSSAIYDNEENRNTRKCLPGTRIAILQRLEGQLGCPKSAANLHFVCLFGSAGSGKSTIMRTLCDRLHKKNQILASFFFRPAPSSGCNTADNFVPTLAYQICSAVPTLQQYVEQRIQSDPVVFSQSLETQMKTLLVDPLDSLNNATRSSTRPPLDATPRAIVIDGLDECQAEGSQLQILRCLTLLAKSFPIPLSIFITRRTLPEFPQQPHPMSLSLDAEEDRDDDIRRFFEHRFKILAAKSPRHRRHFIPNPSLITLLVSKAAGRFIFAETIMCFIEQADLSPEDALKAITDSLVSGNTTALPDSLDALYTSILDQLDGVDMPDRLKLLGLISESIVFEYGSVQSLSFSLVEKVMKWETGRCRALLRGLGSVAREGNKDKPIEVYHDSWVDFLHDPKRSGRFHVPNPGSFTYELLLRAFIAANFWFEDEDLRKFEKMQFQVLFDGVEWSEDLIYTIRSIDFEEMEQRILSAKVSPSQYGPHTWIHICNAFLLSLYHSKYPRNVDLYQSILPSFTSVARRRIQRFYIDRPDLGIVLFASSPSYFGMYPQPFYRHFSAVLIELEREEGLCLLANPGPSNDQRDSSSAGFITPPLSKVIIEMLASGPGCEIKPINYSINNWRRKAFQGVLERLMASDMLLQDPTLISALLLDSQLFSEKYKRNKKKGETKRSEGLEAFDTCPSLAATLRKFLDIFSQHLDPDNRQAIEAYLERVGRATDVHPLAALRLRLGEISTYILQLLDGPPPEQDNEPAEN